MLCYMCAYPAQVHLLALLAVMTCPGKLHSLPLPLSLQAVADVLA